jgi:hypothetical protein
LTFTAKKPPEEDSGNQSGECPKPFTLPAPSWKLATHIALPTVLCTRLAGRKKQVGGSCWQLT